MVENFFEGITEFSKNLAPVFIILNIAVGIILLVAGVVLLKKVDKTRKQRICGQICIVISILGFLGAISNWGVSYFIF